MSSVLELDDIRVDRRGSRILDGISFKLQEAEFVALIGSNGSGKTTLLRTIMGFVHPSSGNIRLFNDSAVSRRAARKRIGYVPQALSIDFKMPMTVRDVVSMGRYGLVGPGRRLEKNDLNAVEQAIKDVGISALSGRPIGHLSGGELQKVQIARALCQTPSLLLLDEPTSNLDLGAQRECLDLIGRLHREHHLTTLIVMHDLKSLPASCSRALILDNASIVFDGAFESAFTEENLSHVYKHQGSVILRELLDEISRKGTPA